MHRGLLGATAMALFAVGCGKGPEMAPVSGKVTYGGEPVQHAHVSFFPQGIPDAPGETYTALLGKARTDEEGNIRNVTTLTKGDGAVVGNHVVTITEGWPAGKPIPIGGMGMERIPPRGPWEQTYRDSVGSPLTVEVVADQENHFEFDLSE